MGGIALCLEAGRGAQLCVRRWQMKSGWVSCAHKAQASCDSSVGVTGWAAVTCGQLPEDGLAALRQGQKWAWRECSWRIAPSLPFLPAEPPTLMAAACKSHCYQLLFPWPEASVWGCQKVLEVAESSKSAAGWHLMEPGGAASWQGRGLCIAWRQLPGLAMLMSSLFQCIFLSPLDCTELKSLYLTPPHAAL